MRTVDEAILRGRRMHRDIAHVMLLALIDVYALFEAFIFAYRIRAGDPAAFAQRMSLDSFAVLAAGLAPVWIAIFACAGLYNVRVRRGAFSDFGRISVAVSCGVMLLIVLDYMRTTPIFPGRSVPIYAVLIGIPAVFGGRLVMRAAVRSVYGHGRGLRKVVIIGDGPLALHLAADMSEPVHGYKILAAVSAANDGGTFACGTPVFRTLDDALDANPGAVDEVLQADEHIDRAEFGRLASLANSRGIVYRFVPDHYGIYAASSALATIDGVPVMQVSLTALDGWGAVLKRSVDVLFCLAVIVLVAPALLIIGLLVKLSDPEGPVIYRQERVGRLGLPIKVAKFRTMSWKYSTGPGRPYASAEDAFLALGRPDLCEEFGREHKVHDDPRVSKIGSFLRRTSLDELPQLFDALRGDLSLIGPRPVTYAELERYGTQRASFLALRPGITGLWQVSGRNDVSYDERVKLDIHYIENWSLKLDISILARTATAVVAKRGAY